MRRLLVALAAAILAWIGAPGVAMAAVAAPDSPAHAYTYDTPFQAVPGDGFASERGPPTTRDPMSAYDAVDRQSHGASARLDGSTPRPATRYARAATVGQVAHTTSTTSHHAGATCGDLSSPQRPVGAANGGERLLWTSWQNYPKVTQGGREYAQIGDRLYSHHAVDRLQPSGLGAPAGATGAGRSISPNFVEDVLGSAKGVPVKGPNGEARLSFTGGSVQVITENNIVITVITR